MRLGQSGRVGQDSDPDRLKNVRIGILTHASPPDTFCRTMYEAASGLVRSLRCWLLGEATTVPS